MIQANALHIPLSDESVHCVVTSPPYFGLRDYNCDGQIGLEASPSEYIETLVAVFREVWRVLRDDGTCWLNLGDSYANDSKWGGSSGGMNFHSAAGGYTGQRSRRHTGLKPKDMMLMPHRVAIALQADGVADARLLATIERVRAALLNDFPYWDDVPPYVRREIDAMQSDYEGAKGNSWYCRSTIIWEKPTVMPESVQDRPTTAHEYIFLLTKQPHYFYDADAIRTPLKPKTYTSHGSKPRPQGNDALGSVKSDNWGRTVDVRKPRLSAAGEISGANKRTVWTVASKSLKEAHFATFPLRLIEPMIKAGTSEYGCCPECAAPWKRIVKVSGGAIGQSWHDHGADSVQGAGQYSGINRGADAKDANGNVYTRKSVGWEPTCECGHENTVPAIVFDPFSGSGTTVIVAHNLERRGIGIDLSYEYCQMARTRMSTDFGAGSTTAASAEPQELTPMEQLIAQSQATKEP